MKTYVIILSDKFPTSHPRKGQETKFGSSLLNGKKIHTIRGNYSLWEKRIKEVQEGLACLSVRQWNGVPYRSSQKEIKRLTAENGVGIQKVFIAPNRFNIERLCSCIVTGGFAYATCASTLAENDGLSYEDWSEFFKEADFNEPLAIIHFTNFRYYDTTKL